MRKFKRGIVWASGVFSGLMTFIPDGIFSSVQIVGEEQIKNFKLFPNVDSDGLNITIAKLVTFATLFVICLVTSCFYACFKKVKIKSNGYTIVVEYGDLFKKKNGQRVINFDECYTSTVGTRPADIKKGTVCGQYLIQNPNLDIHALINTSSAKPCIRKSKYNNSACYEPGTIVPNGDDLLMAFTKLEPNGKSMKFTVDEYLKCLSLLWEEIDNNYNNKDVYIPVLGSGIARFENGNTQSIPRQELVDLIITSYKLSPHKLKNNNALHIVCRRSDDFSMDKVC